MQLLPLFRNIANVALERIPMSRESMAACLNQ
ncbi:hypothetical protein OIU74_008611 [Salix koriyanagi]|uniref:Uncharacterized protein n=1 Tax=Salix koriyanagi TaxID=2511006 RepID=A0A9Q0YZH1_9ROSI|nr:hypothetical protein OIU74_008611 [Salix koriyanagi]